MTKEHALRLLRSGYFSIHKIAQDLYQDDASKNTKRARLEWRIKQESIGAEEIKFIEKIVK